MDIKPPNLKYIWIKAFYLARAKFISVFEGHLHMMKVISLIIIEFKE